MRGRGGAGRLATRALPSGRRAEAEAVGTSAASSAAVRQSRPSGQRVASRLPRGGIVPITPQSARNRVNRSQSAYFGAHKQMSDKPCGD